MASIKSLTHVLAGLGLTTALFLGCQDLTSQAGGSGTATVTDPATQEVSLKLSIKDSKSCLELKDKIAKAHLTGAMAGPDDSAFAANCVQEVRGADTTKPVPPGMIPDDKTRCRWIRTQIDVGRDEMTIKFRHYCPDDCDTLSDSGSVVHLKYCRDPKHDTDVVRPPKHDTDTTVVWPPKHDSDTTVVRPPRHDSDTVIVRLPHHDSDTVRCDTIPRKPPVDTLPPKNICDSLKLFMSMSTPGTQIHRDQEAAFKLHCTEPKHDTVIVVPPKHDTDTTVIVTPRPNCDSLRLRLSKLDTASADYARIKHQMGESCPVPKPPVVVPPKPVIPKVNCDELRAKLAKTDTTSADYARLLGSLRENCPVR